MYTIPKAICTRCNKEFETLLVKVGKNACCDKCKTDDEWICEACHQPIILKEDKGVSVASAFCVCASCIIELDKEK